MGSGGGGEGKTFGFFEDALDGAAASAAGHLHVEGVVVFPALWGGACGFCHGWVFGGNVDWRGEGC